MTGLTDVLQGLGVIVVTVGEREISAKCPFHADNHPSFSMNADSGLWICYQCSERGTLEMLVEKVGGTSSGTTELVRELKRSSIGAEKPAPTVSAEIDPLMVTAEYESFGEPPEWALESRLFSVDIARAYGVRWNKGWVIPIVSPSGDLGGWQFKRMDFVSNYPPAVKKSQTLFGLGQLSSGTVVLVESPLDVCRLAQAGVDAVASYGAFVSKEQIRLLLDASERIVLALDADVEGRRQTDAIWQRLARAVPTDIASYPTGCKDPGDMTDEQVTRTFNDIHR